MWLREVGMRVQAGANSRERVEGTQGHVGTAWGVSGQRGRSAGWGRGSRCRGRDWEPGGSRWGADGIAMSGELWKKGSRVHVHINKRFHVPINGRGLTPSQAEPKFF